MRAPFVPSTANVLLQNSNTCRLPGAMGGTSIGVPASDGDPSAGASLAASDRPASAAPPAPLDPLVPPVPPAPVAGCPPAPPEPFDPAVPPEAIVLLVLLAPLVETLPAEPPAVPDARGPPL